jgi:hypothetical protein
MFLRLAKRGVEPDLPISTLEGIYRAAPQSPPN